MTDHLVPGDSLDLPAGRHTVAVCFAADNRLSDVSVVVLDPGETAERYVSTDVERPADSCDAYADTGTEVELEPLEPSEPPLPRCIEEAAPADFVTTVDHDVYQVPRAVVDALDEPLCDETSSLVVRPGRESEEHARLIELRHDGLLTAIGLRMGDEIESINNRPVTPDDDFFAFLFERLRDNQTVNIEGLRALGTSSARPQLCRHLSLRSAASAPCDDTRPLQPQAQRRRHRNAQASQRARRTLPPS